MTYEKFLTRIVDKIYKEAAFTWTWVEFAKEAGVCYSTVYKLGMRITRFPQHRTIYLLARAVGMDIDAIKKDIRKYKAAA